MKTPKEIAGELAVINPEAFFDRVLREAERCAKDARNAFHPLKKQYEMGHWKDGRTDGLEWVLELPRILIEEQKKSRGDQ